jgi:hypothetical protein
MAEPSFWGECFIAKRLIFHFFVQILHKTLAVLKIVITFATVLFRIT